MRTLILLAIIVSAYGADFASDPEVVAARKAAVEADNKLLVVMRAKMTALGLQEMPAVKLSNDPTRSEEQREAAVYQYNQVWRRLETIGKPEMRDTIQGGWRTAFCQNVDELMKLRAQAGVPIAPPNAAPVAKPKSQITATLPDGTVIKQ